MKVNQNVASVDISGKRPERMIQSFSLSKWSRKGNGCLDERCQGFQIADVYTDHYKIGEYIVRPE